jgi:hypothetical protein
MKTKLNKRKPMLVIDRFHFQLKNLDSKRTIKFQRCTNRACDVLLYTTLDDEFSRYSDKPNDHCHLFNPAQSEIRNPRENMRERAKKECLSLQEIAEQDVQKALLTDEALAVLSRVINMDHNLVHTRRKTTSALLQSSMFAIPHAYSMNDQQNERLLLHDSHDRKCQSNKCWTVRSAGRMLVWSSDTQLDLLFDSEKLHMDGTFSYVSKASSGFAYFLLTFAHEPVLALYLVVLGVELNSASNGAISIPVVLLEIGVLPQILGPKQTFHGISCWHSPTNLCWLSTWLCWVQNSILRRMLLVSTGVVRRKVGIRPKRIFDHEFSVFLADIRL